MTKINKDLIPYFNNSNNNATDEGYSCDYINKAFGWKYLGTKTGTTAISLPSSFNELLIFVDRTNGNSYYQFSIPYGILTSSYRDFMHGYCITQQNNSGACDVKVSQTSARTSYVYANGENDVTSNTSLIVYYR